jgi:putative lipoic acid-binding regulatory protein
MNSRSLVARFGSRASSPGAPHFSLLVSNARRIFSRNVAASSSAGGEDGPKKTGESSKSQSSRSSKGFGASSRRVGNVDANDQDVSNTEALLQTLGEVSKTSGRDPKNNLVLSDSSADSWKEIDEKVNQYPIDRNFQAIGSGGEEFKAAMVTAIESVLGISVPSSKISMRHSSGKKYVSVNIGPVKVETSAQLTAIYQAMSTDSRLKWWM